MIFSLLADIYRAELVHRGRSEDMKVCGGLTKNVSLHVSYYYSSAHRPLSSYKCCKLLTKLDGL